MTNTDNNLRNFLAIPYDQLEKLNLEAAEKRETVSPAVQEKYYRMYLTKENRIKAVTLGFTNIEGRFHMLDYDKKYFLKSADNLTFDGSSVRGFTEQAESDLYLKPDWTSFFWLPADVFGAGKVIMFADIMDKNKQPYESDLRGRLKSYAQKLKTKQNIIPHLSAEIEGFLVEGEDAEQNFKEETGFKLVSGGGYYHSLPMDKLRLFIDAAAEAQRVMGFKNEKDHPEVAPSQFELNFSYTPIMRACDLIQLYKLVCRQVAEKMGMTATFLPKPISGVNGSGMHLNFSLARAGKNIFYDPRGREHLSKLAWEVIARLLNHAGETALVFNSSVNAYRRLDPHFEAPNQIKVSPTDRGSMIRLPIGNEKTSRLEYRSIAPDANPYLAALTILQTGLEGEKLEEEKDKRPRTRFLPGDIHEALRLFKGSTHMEGIMGAPASQKFVQYKQAAADRSPRELGHRVKTSEVIYHHDVFNQMLWNDF